ncbi:hypothetical protein B0A55_02226 [Friedmanniomyces simplex]|uniref:Uncharacterized protein n=1 Tax=Friedmanniomyces simplex TaxID=329884 RepID=A0A4U0XQW1_9PEZI|nr:hypothetical protein B0A55_02226 [Friedmanniomyces simplex]
MKGKERRLAKQAAISRDVPKTAPPPNTPLKTYKVSVAKLLHQAEAVASWAKRMIRKTGLQILYSNEGHALLINYVVSSYLRETRIDSNVPVMRTHNAFQFNIDATGALDTGDGADWLNFHTSLFFDIYDLKSTIDCPVLSE